MMIIQDAEALTPTGTVTTNKRHTLFISAITKSLPKLMNECDDHRSVTAANEMGIKGWHKRHPPLLVLVRKRLQYGHCIEPLEEDAEVDEGRHGG
jgi:hypothetical protein